MKNKIVVSFLFAILLTSCFTNNKESRCRSIDKSKIKLTEMDEEWTCYHYDYSPSLYEGSFGTGGMRPACDVWTPPNPNTPFENKEITYWNSTLLEETDVYSSPYWYETLDGKVQEFLYIRYDFHERNWRCSYEHAEKSDSNKKIYYTRTDSVSKAVADSIKNAWLKINSDKL